jgi:glycosyltransferase involved in cell wall biosynthesis
MSPEAGPSLGHRLRVLHAHCSYREAGGEDAVVRAERHLLREHGVDVLESNATNDQPTGRAAAAFALSAWNPARFFEFRRIAAHHRVDVAHIHNTWFTLSPSVIEALRSRGIPVVMTVHNYRLACLNSLLLRDAKTCTDCVGRVPWRGVVHRCYRSSTAASAAAATTTVLNRAVKTWHRGVERFLVLTEYQAHMLTGLGIDRSKVAKIANFVPDPGPRPSDPSMSNMLLYVGRLASEKGVDVLLRAWRRWRPAGTWSLVIAGDGPARSSLSALADDRVSFLGAVRPEEVRALMLRARCLLMPSLAYEGQPMAVIEALSCRLPVMGASGGGIAELIKPLGTDWLVPMRTAAWEESFELLLDGDRVDAMAARCRTAYVETHHPTVAAERLVAVYREVA